MTTITIDPITQIKRLCASVEAVREKNIPISGVDESKDSLATWDAIIAKGKVRVPGGERMTAAQFLQRNTKWLSTPWQKVAYDWALDHPGKTLVVEFRIGRQLQTWVVGKRGEYVMFVVPWWQERRQVLVSRDRKTRVLINID